MEKKSKKIRLMSIKELEEKMTKCVQGNLQSSAYYGHLKARHDQLVK